MQCIHTIQPDAAQNMPQAVTPGFEFIAGPIQMLFRDQPPSLTTILKIFSVLAFRFRRQYIHTAKMEWHLPLDTSILFLEDCLNSTSPKDLARTLTGTDELDFSGLPQQSILANDAFVRGVLTNWQNLSISVWECCAALPDMVPFLRECTEVSDRPPCTKYHFKNGLGSLTDITAGPFGRRKLSFSDGSRRRFTPIQHCHGSISRLAHHHGWNGRARPSPLT